MAKVTDEKRNPLHAVFFWALIFAGIGLLFLVVGLPVVRHRHTMDVVVEQMTGRNVALYGQLDRLKKERLALLGDPFYVEKLARRNLHMRRAGEMQVGVTPTTYSRHLRDAQHHITTTPPVGLWRVYETLNALAEDSLFRRIAVGLALLTVIAGFLLFGRTARRRRPA